MPHIHAALAAKERARFPIGPGRHWRGRRPGGFVLGARINLANASATGATTKRAAADAFVANVLPVVRQIEASGVKGHRAIAAALKAGGRHEGAGGPRPRGG